MIILGITGGSGTGKTTVSKIITGYGIDVIDTDKVARMVVEPGEPALLEIEQSFGKEYILPDGTLNRKKLASAVFSDKEKLELLNSITHKYITEYVNSYISNHTGEIIGIDGAALIESGIYKQCDYLLSVLADKEIRIKRIVDRDNLSFDEAKTRIEAQKCDNYYVEKSDYIVYNNGNEESLRLEIKKIIDDLRSRA